MKFELSKKEQERAHKLYKKWKKKLKGKGFVNMYYIFYPTGVGNGVEVGCKALGVKKDITDYSDW